MSREGHEDALEGSAPGEPALTPGDAPAHAGAMAEGSSPDAPAHAGSVANGSSPDAPAHAPVRPPEVAHAAHPHAARNAAVRKAVAGRRGTADPVRALMHRHRELCERAVDPLEIAAGLEAHGVTDRTAARYRHRDVFSLAEELFARVPAVAGSPSRRAPLRRATSPRAPPGRCARCSPAPPA